MGSKDSEMQKKLTAELEKFQGLQKGKPYVIPITILLLPKNVWIKFHKLA